MGHTDLPLSLEGALAIHRLVDDALQPLTAHSDVVRVVSSDLRRALGSAWLTADVTRRVVESDPRLREISFGEWDGKSWVEIERADPVRLRQWMEHWTDSSAPGGESVHDLQHRAVSWLADNVSLPAAPGAPARAIVIVSHAGWIRAAVSHLLGTDIGSMFEIPVDYAHVTAIDIASGGPRLVASNVVRARP